MAITPPVNPFAPAQSPFLSSEPPSIPDHTLLRRIGVGSYGEVWLARSATAAHRAVKVVYRDNFSEERPFLREFAGIKKFEPISRSHESQVDILHVGATEKYFYYVMELADDQQRAQAIDPDTYKPRTLRSDLARLGSIPFDECVRIALALATALDHLHRNGLAHRDIKPSNIIFVNGIPKLADIGLVAGLDETRSFVGTEGFVAPEGAGSPQADIYSFGKMLYEMCTGLDRADFPELPTLLLEHPGRDQILELNAIITRACKHDPRDRYQSARELHSDLSLLQSGKSVRRSRTVELRLKYLSRAAVVTVAIGALLAAAFLFQRRQTASARKLAAANLALAQENREQVVRLLTAAGTRHIAKGELMFAALMYAEALQSAPPGSEEERLQRLRIEWILRDSASVEAVFPHNGAVNQARLSPDEQTLITLSDDKTAKLWSLQTGELLAPPIELPERGFFGSFSPDGNYFVTGSGDGTVQVWDAATRQPHGSPVKHSHWLRAAAFSPDGRLLLTAAEHARLWDVPSMSARFAPFKNGSSLTSAAFSQDGRQVITTGNDRHARVWSAEDGRQLHSFAHKSDVDSAWISPDSTRVATLTARADEGHSQFNLWNNLTGEHIYRSHRLPAEYSSFIRFSPVTNEIIVGGSPIFIYDGATNRYVTRGQQGPLRDIAFSPNGELTATASERAGFAYVWSARTRTNLVPPMKHGGYVNSVHFTRGGAKLLTASDDGAARLWNLAAPGNIAATLDHGKLIFSAAFVGNASDVLVSDVDDQLHVWDSKSPGPQHIPFERNATTAAAVSADGRKTLSGVLRTTLHQAHARPENNPAVVHDRTRPNAAPLRILPDAPLTASAIDPTSRFVATGTSAGICQVWDADTGEAIGPRLTADAAVTVLAFSPDSKWLFAGNAAGGGKVWAIADGGLQSGAIKHTYAIHNAAFSSDSKRIVTGSLDQTGRIWDALTGQPLTEPFKHGGNVLYVGFSPDDRFVFTAGLAPYTLIWDSKTGKQALPALEHTTGVNGAVFHPTRPILLTGSNDKTARLWDLTTAEPLTPPLPHGANVVSVDFSRDGNSFLTAAGNHVRIWSVPNSSRPNDRLIDLVQLLSSHQYAPSGAHFSLSPAALADLSRKVRPRSNSPTAREISN